MIEWHRVEQEIEREFVALCRRVLIGLPEREGIARAEQRLSDYREHMIEMTMKVKARFGAVEH
jgi:hypothetical protein